MESFRSLIKRRRTCRNYSEQPLTKEQITALINDAVWVPSGSNNQPWQFAVITDKAKLKTLSDTAKQGWLDKLDTTPYMRQYETFLRDPGYNIFYNAPALVIIYGCDESNWSVYDCSMVALNMHLLAQEDGLGCCWIGFAHNVLNDPAMKRELGIPEQYQLVAPLILGHPTKKIEHVENPNRRKPFKIHFA